MKIMQLYYVCVKIMQIKKFLQHVYGTARETTFLTLELMFLYDRVTSKLTQNS